MQYSQEHLKTMVYAEFGGQTECIMGYWKIENNFHTITGEWPTNLRCHIIFHTIVTATVLQNRHKR